MPARRGMTLWVAFTAVALAAAPGPARADRPAARHHGAGHLSGKRHQSFWTWLLDPHGAEIRLILRKQADLKKRLNTESVYDYTGTYYPQRAETRRHLLDEAEGMLRYALTLQPHQVEVERALALVLDENQKATAQAALEQALADASGKALPSHEVADLRLRLGRWYARQRRWNDAAAQLRTALGIRSVSGRARLEANLLLASIYMNSGRLAQAIDLLRSANPVPTAGWGADYLTPFALAVAYDRDEQITRAHDVLNRLASNPDALEHVIVNQSSPPERNPLIPAVEAHYFRALQDEALGYLPEARMEWQAYARADDAPFRARARQHIADIDRMLRKAQADGSPTAGSAGRPTPKHTPYRPMPRRHRVRGGKP